MKIQRDIMARGIDMAETIRWTDEQLQAIEEKGKNLLVSAAAGSGKTAVLVERIKRIIIDEKTDIDRLLVVTFTNAAASEMKEKILKALHAEVNSCGKDDETSEFLRRQIELISDADISTFHAFGLRIIRENFQLTDFRPDFKIADDGELGILRREVMDELFEEMYAEAAAGSGDEEYSFTDFLDAYSSDRNDNRLKENLIDSYIRIMNIPDPFKWLDEKTADYESISEELSHGELGMRIRSCIKVKLKDAVSAFGVAEHIVDERGLPKLTEKCSQDIEAVRDILEAVECGDADRAKALVCSFKAAVMRASKEEKEDWEDIREAVAIYRDHGKKAVNYLKDRFFLFSEEEYAEDIMKLSSACRMFSRIIKEFHVRYKAQKNENNIIEFNDIEHSVLQILENENVCSLYRDRYRYIFVDEYQDSNVLQESLLSRICSENNMFMVGDIKQSIYKFRLAEPEIFKDKYDRFSRDETGLDMKLDLNMNFRSKRPVIDAVNGIFEKVMDEYDEAASLKAGDGYDGEYLPPAELCIVDRQQEDDLPDEIKDLKDAELEAHAAAEYIHNIVGTVFHDSKQNIDREVCLRDIVVLTGSVKGVSEQYARIFSEQGIPVFMDNSSGYFDTIEVEVFLNLLRVIDNSMQDVPLVSVMNSSIGGFTVDEITRIRLYDMSLPYYSVISEYADCESGAGDELALKCREFLDMINRFSGMASGIPLDVYIWRLLMETGYFSYVGALPDGAQRQANLRALIDKAVQFKNRKGGGIYEFLSYIDSVNKVVDIGQARLLGEQDDVVRIMTIHKSKGLEFPVVIVTGLGKDLNRQGRKSKQGITIHKDIGIGLSRVNYKEMWLRKTMLQLVIDETEREEERQERIRVLYVALTRARDRLILIGSVSDADKMLEIYRLSGSVAAARSYIDYIAPCIRAASLKLKIFKRAQVKERTGLSEKRAELVEKVLGDEAVCKYRDTERKTAADEVERRLSFSYAYGGECGRKSKYSVSEINRDRSKGLTFVRPVFETPSFMAEKRDITAAERGTIYHLIMENLDFSEALNAKDAGYITSFVSELVSEGKLTETQAEMIDPEKILAFFDTDLGQRAAAAEKAGRKKTEESFNIVRIIDGVPVMVQGVIDCFFKEDDGYVLIDYKSNHLSKVNVLEYTEKLKEIYAAQIEIYREAIETITGEPVKEAWLYLFDKATPVDMNE